MINASSFQTCNHSLILERHSEIIASKISSIGNDNHPITMTLINLIIDSLKYYEDYS